MQDPEAFAILSTTPRSWRYTDETSATDLAATSCPIRLAKPGGRVVSVSHNNRSAAPLSSLAADQVAGFYRATRSFRRLLTSKEFELRLRLNAGDVLVFANNRVPPAPARAIANAGHANNTMSANGTPNWNQVESNNHLWPAFWGSC